MSYPRRPERLDLEVKCAARLTEEEVDRVTELIVVAFDGVFPPSCVRVFPTLLRALADLFRKDDPFGHHLVGGDTALTPLQFRSVIAAANVGGTIILGTTKSEDGRDELAGVLIAFGPGQSLNSTEEQVVAGWNPFIEKVDEYTRKWWSSYWIPLLDRTCDTAFGEGGTLRAWDLQLLGVRPEHHGRGVASAIMRYAISLADAENAPMVLETQNERNVAMYSKMGFEVKEVINVESRAGTSRFWFMGRGF